jgi:iron complex outermembrane receptor protein
MRTLRCACSPLALATALIAGAASAQSPAPEASPPAAIAEVVVTAEKRSENLQAVPIAITAFTAERMQERAVGDVSTLGNLTPNVTLTASTPFSGSTAVLSAYIRGIGSNDFAFNIDPGVGIYVDGVYLARTIGANQDLLDVQRVEILKGPQGTLFGRNTIGGAISIVTKDPASTFGGNVDLQGGSFNQIRLRGTVDVPLADNLRTSVTFGMERQDGYLKRIPYPGAVSTFSDPATSFKAAGYSTTGTEGLKDNWNVRLKAVYTPTANLKITIAADYTDNHDTSATKALGIFSSGPGSFAGTANLPGTALDPTGRTGFNFAGLYNFCISASPGQIAARNATALCGVRGTQYNPQWLLPALAGSNQLPYDQRFLISNPDRSYSTGADFSNLTTAGIAGTIEYALPFNMTLRSITAYRGLDWTSGSDADGSPLTMAQLGFDMAQRQFSQEFQLLGATNDQRLKWVGGLYYFEESGHLHDYVTFSEGLLQVDGPNQLSTNNEAAFGQIDWRPIDLIGVTLGGRYTQEDKRFTGGQQDLNGFDYKLFGCSNASGVVTPGGPFPLAPIPCQVGIGYPVPSNPVQLYRQGSNQLSFGNFSPKVGLQIHPASDIMGYVSYSQGYKTGGWTTRLTNPLPTAPTFDPETATTWEVGLKSQWLERRLQLNLALFTTDYRNIQLNFQEGTSPTIANAGNAQIKGVEAEGIVNFGSGLTLNSSVGYLDAHYTAVAPGVAAVSGSDAFQAGALVGGDLPNTPRWKANISPRYQYVFSGGSKMIATVDITYTGQSWLDAQRTYLLRQRANTLANFSVSYSEPKDRWSVAGGVTNLSDTRFLTVGNENLADGLIYGGYNRPREFYGRISVKF